VSSPPLPRLGSVVWAELEDANGFRKVRPVVVLTATADIAAGGRLRVVAITTRLPTPLPDDHVLLPWDREGKARSGLRRKCAAVTTWQAEIAVADVQQVVGHLPPAVMEELLTKAVAAMPPDASGETSNGSSSSDPSPPP
jgi:mRNA-degrading endonuclease toxin of MazEF toxin-antitoxin module